MRPIDGAGPDTTPPRHQHEAGGDAGKASLGERQLGKTIVDAATVPLFDKLVCGDHIGEAIRHCRQNTGNGGKALEFRKFR